MTTDDARAALRAQVDAIREASVAKVLIQLDRKDVEAAWQKASDALALRDATKVRASPAGAFSAGA